jgi:uncharacterized protein YlxP (DUF503 family)
VFTGTLVVDVLLGDVHSLKGKRAVVRPIVSELRPPVQVGVPHLGGGHGVPAAQFGHDRAYDGALALEGVHVTDLHRRAQLGMATVAGDVAHVTDVLDTCERWVAGRPDIELLSTHRQLFSSDD